MTNKAQEIAKLIWQEMIDRGYGEDGEEVTDSGLADFIANQTIDAVDWELAADGDVAALVRIRTNAGLPLFR